MAEGNTRTAEEWFNHFAADNIKTDLGHVSGYVPHMNVEPLLNKVEEAHVQYWTDDEYEAFVTTL